MKIIRLQGPAPRKSTFNMAARREFSVRDCVKSYVIDIQRRFERGNHDADGLDYTVFRLD